jgi:hypothetical protein
VTVGLLLPSLGSELNDVMDLITFAGWDKAGEDHSDHAFFDRYRVADFEFRLVQAAYQGCLTWCFLHIPIVMYRRGQIVVSSLGLRSCRPLNGLV